MKVQELFSTMNFTPNAFFGAKNDKIQTPQHQGYSNAPKPTTNTSKRIPKLMEQRIEMPLKGGRNSPKESGQVNRKSEVIARLSNSSPDYCQKVNNKQHRNHQVPSMNSAVTANIFETPHRRTPNNNGLRREQSASIIIPYKRAVSAACVRYTPPATFASGDNDGLSAIFAGSRFIESPSAKSLPLPPSHWLTNKNGQKMSPEVEGNSSGSESDDIQSDFTAAPTSENFISGTWSPVAITTTYGTKSPSGIRIHPLHLIAAAVMSP